MPWNEAAMKKVQTVKSKDHHIVDIVAGQTRVLCQYIGSAAWMPIQSFQGVTLMLRFELGAKGGKGGGSFTTTTTAMCTGLHEAARSAVQRKQVHFVGVKAECPSHDHHVRVKGEVLHDNDKGCPTSSRSA